MWELTKSFRFEAAHSLKGTTFGADSEEIHGHSFRAEVSVRGTPDPQPAWCWISACSNAAWKRSARRSTTSFLNKVEALGTPTLENISRFILERVQHAGKITRVSVHRDSCNESCTYFGPQGYASDGNHLGHDGCRS